MENLKMFGRWDNGDVEIHDDGLKRYINLEAIMAPRSRGRHDDKQFYKADVPIVERLLNRMYVAGHRGSKHKISSGHNVGKSGKQWTNIEKAFEIIEDETGQNPIQVLVDALENSSAREEVVSYQRGGVIAREAVVISPQRRIDLALRNLVQGAYEKRLSSEKSASQTLAEEIVGAANEDSSIRAVRDKQRREREAEGAR